MFVIRKKHGENIEKHGKHREFYPDRSMATLIETPIKWQIFIIMVCRFEKLPRHTKRFSARKSDLAY